jgi:hypothetical protein
VRVGPEFALGLIVGELSVLATIMLACVVLLAGGETDWSLPVRVLLVLHLPIAALEGVVVGFLVGFLARVKPELLGWPPLIEDTSRVSPDTVRALAVGIGAGGANGVNCQGAPAAGEVLRAAGEPRAGRELLQHEGPGR